MTIKETVAAAKAAGLSYGEYVKRENERKAARLGMSYDDIVTGRDTSAARRQAKIKADREYWTPKREAVKLRRATAVIATDKSGRETKYNSVRDAYINTGISTNTIWKIIHGERGAWIKGHTFRLADKQGGKNDE